MRRILILTLLYILAFPLQAQTAAGTISIVVTIKPVHSLVTGIMKGVGEPALIMSGSASPHHYTLRPSERRTLANADLIFWVGPELESFMPRILDSLDPSSTNIALMQSAGLLRLPARTVQHHSKHARIDPHIWLSANNAHAMVDTIANELIRRDATHADTYEANRQLLHKRISETDKQIHRKLSGKSSAYISYHDAYQYFEKAYGLNNVGFVSSGDEISPSAKYVHELRNIIQKEQLHCLFYEAPTRPALVDTLIRDHAVQAFELDAMGIRIESGENSWFDIMHKLADVYDACL